MEKIGQNKCFGGNQLRYKHASPVLGCDMTFSIYLPPGASADAPVPVIYWLSGLTCTDENFVQKAGAQKYAAEHGVALVAPDTSPRGEHIPRDPDGAWDFGLGAGFYLDATNEPWRKNYRMYSYITEELPKLIEAEFPLTSKKSIMGHSMGGHGALTIALKNPGVYNAASAFSPICAPMECPWGVKAFSRYLGEDKTNWRQYDTCALIAERKNTIPLLVEQGSADSFLVEQLQPEKLQQACAQNQHPLDLRIRDGYDHSYFFIATFIGEHVAYHAERLKQ
ncbi:S-formylglutathione hydrolase [Saccharophagus sp. K07]|uniref:S-formylglutathione hydrolase n=1 Tax=Saccharophagus sp. K07 TaxID=2283636 RepID=UPI001652388B